jgi:hypothetical protein
VVNPRSAQIGKSDHPDIGANTPIPKHQISSTLGAFHMPCRVVEFSWRFGTGCHWRAHGILGGKDAVAFPGLCELTDEGKVDRSRWHRVRLIAGLAWHEEGGDVRHHHRHSYGAGRSQFGDVLDRYASVVEPFLVNFLAVAFLHRLLHIIAGLLDKQREDPNHNLGFGLQLEVGCRLTVQLSSQNESFQVKMPPVTTLPLNGSRVAIFWMRSSGVVTATDSRLVSGM